MPHVISRRTGAHPESAQPAARHGRGWSPLRRLGAWLGLSSGAAARPARSQRVTAIDACAAFRRGDEFLHRARRDRVPVTVLVLELHDLPELECVFGGQTARKAIDHTMAGLQRVAGAQGMVLRTDPTLFTVLLPDSDREDTLDLLRTAFGQSCSLELETDGEDLVLVPEFAMRILCTETLPLVDVHHGLCCEIQQARTREQQRQDYLQRERESHSRPMSLPAPPEPPSDRKPRRAPQAEPYPPVPMTIPVPLGRR